ncbi:glycosyltransferase [Paenibacillus sp. J5C_2022]|uniref:glycosyltransferase family protein n=1 Tax=Paenibacillus sp. J5C2022 TaxID=2977129 RepID=UPI0021D363FE|nr:glycosyltransferase [Paenibacillus sp. J5C2022]MCU6710430.1 glycosyltransferase [Paenibacillus sp. J5C2022]
MSRRLNLLFLVKKFAESMPKHQHKFDMLTAIEQEANVMYWHDNGDIRDILTHIPERPDFIFHYDIEWHYAFAPDITGLSAVNIPTGCYVLDIHFHPPLRHEYFDRKGKPDLIFSASKHPFLDVFPTCKSRFRWLPFSVNPAVIRDYGLEKDIRYSLVGIVNERYPFREAVIEEMDEVEGFRQFQHPGHTVRLYPGMLINEKYASALNRSQMSFTCGSFRQIPVAKFFELPGCRTLMLAEPNDDLEELGFRDGLHYASCNRNNIRERALHYANNVEERQRLTDAGYGFIHQHHSNAVRAKQFVAEIESFLLGKS